MTSGHEIIRQVIRCAIYPRFSDEMQSPRSAGDQERVCREFAERMGWSVVLVERDEAVRAGATAGREGYRRLLSAAKDGKLDVLLVEEISRFSRDFLGGMTELAALTKLRVQVADTKSGILDMNDATGQIRVSVALAISQQETQRLGERSKRGLEGKVRDRFSAGGEPAYGLRRVPVFSETAVDVDGRPKRVGVRLEVHEAEAQVVVRIFRRYDAGAPKHAIARELNQDKIPSKRAGRTSKGTPNSGTWTTCAIKAILENPIYIGVRIWNRHSRTGEKLPRSGKKQLRPNTPDKWIHVEDYAPAIIDRELWDRVQARLKADAARYARSHVANNDRRYLLSGLLTCANCHGSFVIGVHQRGVPHYRCSFRAQRGDVVCLNRTTIPVPGVEAKVRNVLDALAKDPEQLAALVAEHNEKVAAANDDQLGVLRALRARRDSVVQERDRFASAIAIASGPVRVLVTEIEKRERELEDLAGRIDQAKTLVQPLLVPQAGVLADFAEGSASIWRGDLTADRALLMKFVERIFVYAGGIVVVRFRQDALFAPVREVELDIGDGDSEAPLDFKRRIHADALATARHDIAAGRRAKGGELRVIEQHPLHIYDVRAKAKEARGPAGHGSDTSGDDVDGTLSGDPPPRRMGEITLASPAGFEPAYPA